jgi:MEDS: MEthanogen/methylotroph, DcmR Sensory domain
MTVATDDIAVGHVVQFYRHETELTRTTGRYLADTIRAGAVAIAIATQPHRQALEIELRATGIDPAQARRDRAWVTVDAAEALAGLMSDRRIDRRAFRRLIGGLVRAVAAGGRQSPAKPTVRDDRQMAGSGRGLRLVAELAGDWGVDAPGEGKTVWPELLRRRG